MKSYSNAELAQISSRTVADYEGRTDSFWMGTKDHDVSQNIDALLKYVEVKSGANILDFGCGPGRDLADFVARGHRPVGLEGSPTFCEMAREFSGCEVLNQDFLQLDLPDAHFHGVFANATMFHVPTGELPQVLSKLRSSLVPGGILLCSNPRGSNVEGFQSERYCAFHDLSQWQLHLVEAGFELLEHYYRPTGRSRSEQPWLVTVWRRV
jgi:SAM-dependent methyltransferase